MRALIRAALQQIGTTNVREASDGEDGLRALAARPAHMVISDDNMPGLDGPGLLRAVRSRESLKNVAFIMLTGRAEIDLIVRARQFGVNN